MYADDTVILCDSEYGMKQALLALNLYCNEWKLKLNCNKTKVLVFSRGRQNLSNYEIEFGGEKIEIVTGYISILGCYLIIMAGFTDVSWSLRRQLQEQCTH